MRTGQANLPLHGGSCPPWLFERMVDLGGSMVEAMLVEFSRREVLRRLSDPGWFQAFGCVLGFDWHSSGLTTVLCGALKEALNPRAHELGIYVAGGKGQTSRRTPREIGEFAGDHAPSLPVEDLRRTSRLTAQVDSAALQDGHQIYHHSFFLTREGHWAVVQQGMQAEEGWARRYHWLDESTADYLDNPHNGICSQGSDETLNLAEESSQENRQTALELAVDDPVGTLREYKRLVGTTRESSERILNLPRRHDLPRVHHLERSLGKIYDHPVEDFETLLDTKGVGSATVRALSMVAEVVWGVEPSYEDPARYSFAHGGKDGVPYPVDRERYRESMDVLRRVLKQCDAGRSEKMKALRRVAKLARVVESDVHGPTPGRAVQTPGPESTNRGETDESETVNQLELNW